MSIALTLTTLLCLQSCTAALQSYSAFLEKCIEDISHFLPNNIAKNKKCFASSEKFSPAALLFHLTSFRGRAKLLKFIIRTLTTHWDLSHNSPLNKELLYKQMSRFDWFNLFETNFQFFKCQQAYKNTIIVIRRKSENLIWQIYLNVSFSVLTVIFSSETSSNCMLTNTLSFLWAHKIWGGKVSALEIKEQETW